MVVDVETYAKFSGKGVYRCAKCGARLFGSGAKFDSGTRWPSFRREEKGGVTTRMDYSLGMARVEILCKRCGRHLGHVFDDGKACDDRHKKAGKRFCVLSSALKFEEKKGKQVKPRAPAPVRG